MDEGGKQLIGEAREPLPVRPGKPARQDREYKRGGMANLFMAFEPLAGRRHVEVTARKTRIDFARFMKRLADEHAPDAERILLVCDNLSTRSPRRSTRRSSPPRPDAWPSASSGTTPRGTAVGSMSSNTARRWN